MQQAGSQERADLRDCRTAHRNQFVRKDLAILEMAELERSRKGGSHRLILRETFDGWTQSSPAPNQFA